MIADEMRSGFPDKNINYRPWRGEEPKSEDFSSPTDPETLESSCLIRDTIPAAGSCSRPRPSPQGHASWTMMGPLYQGHAAVHLGHAFFVWATPIHQGHAPFICDTLVRQGHAPSIWATPHPAWPRLLPPGFNQNSCFAINGDPAPPDLEISCGAPSGPSPPPLRALRPLSPPFPPCSDFFPQSHFLLLWLLLAGQIRDGGVISGTFEVPINNGAAWPAPAPSASRSDQRLASRRPRPWKTALYWIWKAEQASRRSPRRSPQVPPSSDARPEDFHTQLLVLPGSTGKSEPGPRFTQDRVRRQSAGRA